MVPEKSTVQTLSKSKLLAHRQCPKRLWLELNRKEEAQYSTATTASFATGHVVGEVARRLYDPEEKGVLIALGRGATDAALALTEQALTKRKPIFEAGFASEGALAFADVLLPVRHKGKPAWRMVEVKSSTKIKDVYRDDLAIQSFAARQSGLPLAGAALAHINSDFVYPGDGCYDGLLAETDLTEESFSRADEVRGWIFAAHATARKRVEPPIQTGVHCNEPYECGFVAYCKTQEPQAQYPVEWLPRVQTKALKTELLKPTVTDLRHVSDELLNPQQLKVKKHTLSGKCYFDKSGAADALAAHKLPAYFLDFETIAFAVPVWKGTRPFQQIPFQFSAHRLSRTLQLSHKGHLDLTGSDPSEAFAVALINACGETTSRSPVFVYNKGFESARIKELAARLKGIAKVQHLVPALLALESRLVDLEPIARAHYYHPSQQGSWSIKALLPAMVKNLSYATLDGVQGGTSAQAAYIETAFPVLASVHGDGQQLRSKTKVEEQLLRYCRLDTFAMVKVWAILSGRRDALKLKDMD